MSIALGGTLTCGPIAACVGMLAGLLARRVRPADPTQSSAREHAAQIDAIQRFFLQNTRLGIPIIPFEEALHEGARSVMTAYNSVDGSPATQSRWLLTDVLKRRWGFRGFVISDAAATGGATVLHMTEASTGTAAKHAIEAGLDVIFQSAWPQHRPYLTAFTRGQIGSRGHAD